MNAHERLEQMVTNDMARYGPDLRSIFGFQSDEHMAMGLRVVHSLIAGGYATIPPYDGEDWPDPWGVMLSTGPDSWAPAHTLLLYLVQRSNVAMEDRAAVAKFLKDLTGH